MTLPVRWLKTLGAYFNTGLRQEFYLGLFNHDLSGEIERDYVGEKGRDRSFSDYEHYQIVIYLVAWRMKDF